MTDYEVIEELKRIIILPFGGYISLEAAKISIQAVDFKSRICHCKECIHWVNGVPGCTEHVKFCSIGKYMVGENGYCVYGEKKK